MGWAFSHWQNPNSASGSGQPYVSRPQTMPSPHPQKHAPVKHLGVKRLCASTEAMTWMNMVQLLWLGLIPLATLGFTGRLACLRPTDTVTVNLASGVSIFPARCC